MITVVPMTPDVGVKLEMMGGGGGEADESHEDPARRGTNPVTVSRCSAIVSVVGMVADTCSDVGTTADLPGGARVPVAVRKSGTSA
jgi:hypothetical protein